MTLELDDSYGDGWNANSLTIGGVDYSLPDADGDYTTTTNFSVWMDGPVYLDVCLDLSVCNEVTYNATGSYQTENSWAVYSDGDTLASAGPESGSIGAGCAVLGCMDSAADNYNADATEDDGSCEYTIYGCTDPAADNYNAEANTDNGSCYYSCPDGQAQVDVLVTTDTYSGSENSFAIYVDGLLSDLSLIHI